MTITQSIIADVLRSVDLESLIELGAPKDEYEPEARSIMEGVARLEEKGLSEERLAALIRTEWTSWFGPFSDDEIHVRIPRLRQIAHQIMTAHK